ncbi:MAG: hypothetical protein FWD35_06185, partial [Oscillospiraceae bacterium]|nr:hypothetical protein [Oscillospiraceae bacterium]
MSDLKRYFNTTPPGTPEEFEDKIRIRACELAQAKSRRVPSLWTRLCEGFKQRPMYAVTAGMTALALVIGIGAVGLHLDWYGLQAAPAEQGAESYVPATSTSTRADDGTSAEPVNSSLDNQFVPPQVTPHNADFFAANLAFEIYVAQFEDWNIVYDDFQKAFKFYTRGHATGAIALHVQITGVNFPTNMAAPLLNPSLARWGGR